jgi:hypothetical protein
VSPSAGADIGLVVDEKVGSGGFQERSDVVERSAGQNVTEDDDSDAPPLRPRQLVQPRVGTQREPVGLFDRDAHALRAEAQLAEPRREALTDPDGYRLMIAESTGQTAFTKGTTQGRARRRA